MSFEDEEPGQRLYRTTREARDARRKRRRRRVLLGIAKGFFWILLLSGVFILGIGIGQVAPQDNDSEDGQVTLEERVGPLTAELPTQTVTKETTVTVRAGGGGGGGGGGNADE